MSIADYTERLPDESPTDHLRRICLDFLWARGGNKPEDVRGWLRDNPASMFADAIWSTWAAMANDEHEFIDLDDADEEADLEAFELVEGEPGEGDIADQRGALRAIKRVARKDTRRNQRRAAKAAGKRLFKRADKRPHAEKYAYTLADVTAVFEEIKANGV